MAEKKKFKNPKRRGKKAREKRERRREEREMAKILGGIQTPDELATKVRRIILLSLVIAVIVVIQGFATAILRSKTGNSRVAADSALVKVLYGLSLPFCGMFHLF